jgi:hypothetical protein
MSRLKRRLCHLERQAATRGLPPNTTDQNAIVSQRLLAEYLAAAEQIELTGWEPDTPEKEQERIAVYEQWLEVARRR